MGSYQRPATLNAALQMLSSSAPTVIAGGTDFYPARVGHYIDEDILDITAIDGLRGFQESNDHFHIGAATTWNDVIKADLPPYFHGLQLAARGSWRCASPEYRLGLRQCLQRVACGGRGVAAADIGCRSRDCLCSRRTPGRP